jgi:hypothetical protein
VPPAGVAAAAGSASTCLALTSAGKGRYPRWASMRTGMPTEPGWQVGCDRYLRILAPRQGMSPARAGFRLTREGL